MLFAVLSASASETNLSIAGVVTDGSKPVGKAVVSLVSDSRLADTTDSNGVFHISNAAGISHDAGWSTGNNRTVSLRGNRLCFLIPFKPATVDAVLYTADGKYIRGYSPENDGIGSLDIGLPELPSGVYFVAFSTDRISITRKLVVTAGKVYLCGIDAGSFSLSGNRKLSMTQAGVDQLKITKDGFVDTLVAIASYQVENLSVVLNPVDTNAGETSLYKRYRNYFPIGAAVDGGSYKDAHAAIWKEHFNSMVCENEMKWSSLQSSEGNFQFSQANAMVNAGRSSGMLVRGHVLVWFDMTPDWVFQGSKEQVLGRMRTHITKVMQEFKGRVYAWDVVNEAVIGYDASGNDVGEDLGMLDHWGYRNSKWYQIAGEDFIFEAFKAARAADPDARLFYNDFWNYLDGKRQFIISFVKRLKEQNLIDGVGLQCHLNINPAQVKMTNQTVYQTVENLEKEIREYAALGLDVHITELDISIYTRDYGSDDKSKWYTGADLNEEYQNKLAARYREFFDMFRRNADKIQNVTFWGIADDNTWLSEFDSGRPDHPLLFDKHLQPKKAFDAIMDF